MKWNIFFLIKITYIYTISGNNWKQNTRKLNKLSNIHDKKDNKDKESKIVNSCLRWINPYIVSKDKCNNGIKRESSTGNLSIINRAYLM